MSKPVVLVTGGTGFIGSHIISQLLRAGYPVKAIARTGKGDILKHTHAQTPGKLEVVEIVDLAQDDLSETVKGCGALIHAACPIPLAPNLTSKLVFEGTVTGTLNIINAAIKAGIKKIIYTGTSGSVFESDFSNAFHDITVNETNWPSEIVENVDVDKTSFMQAYMVSKPLAEKKVWELAKQYPEVDITTILPSNAYGPWLPDYPIASKASDFGSNQLLYEVFSEGPAHWPRWPGQFSVDVRDAALAHVLALSAPPLPDGDGRNKRLLVTTQGATWLQIIAHLKKVRPDLVGRLSDPSVARVKRPTSAKIDIRLTTEVLGMKPDDFIPWQQTVTEAVDHMLEWEKRQTKKV